MKKLVAVLLCLMMLSLFSCGKSDRKGEGSNVATDAVTPPLSNSAAMQMYEAAIDDEIFVIDERAGEVRLKDLRFPRSDLRLEECKLLKKAILDIDRDGSGEYVIQSPEGEYIILHCHDNRVYSYRLDVCDFYKFNTDGTFYWYDSSETGGEEYGLSRIVFAEDGFTVTSVYRLAYSEYLAKYEYFVEGKPVTASEYYEFRALHLHNVRMNFSQFELTCAYPVTAEEAWDLANAYWDNQDGCADVAAGTVFTARIVLLDTPNPETNGYRVAFQVESASGGGMEGYECRPPYHVTVYDQILVNAFTGEITAAAYSSDGKGVSVGEAIEIAKADFEYIDFEDEENGYFAEHDADAEAPDHIYVIVIQKHEGDTCFAVRWVDKNTGEIIFPYYLYGKG